MPSRKKRREAAKGICVFPDTGGRRLRSFVYRFPPLAELKFDPECIGKRFSHREGWCWEDDDNATGRTLDISFFPYEGSASL